MYRVALFGRCMCFPQKIWSLCPEKWRLRWAQSWRCPWRSTDEFKVSRPHTENYKAAWNSEQRKCLRVAQKLFCFMSISMFVPVLTLSVCLCCVSGKLVPFNDCHRMKVNFTFSDPTAFQFNRGILSKLKLESVCYLVIFVHKKILR